MNRFAILFLLVGLAAGLWLGFNPAAHRAVVRWWDSTNSSRATASQTPLVNVQGVNHSINRLLRSSARPQPTRVPQTNTVPSGTQISAELQTFWNALQKLWLSFIAQFSRASH